MICPYVAYGLTSYSWQELGMQADDIEQRFWRIYLQLNMIEMCAALLYDCITYNIYFFLIFLIHIILQSFTE